MMLSCCIKNEIKISTLSGDILVLHSLIGPEHFGDKIQKQAVKLLEMTDSVCYIYGSLPIRKESAYLNSVLAYHIFVTRCRIWKQILKNGIQMIGQNAVLAS